MTIHRFVGQVVDASTQVGISAARVEAFDASERYADVLFAALTNSRGEFTMEANTEDLQKLFGDVPPSVFFTVVDPETSTEGKLVWFTGRDGTGRIETGTPAEGSNFIVEGVVGIRSGTTLQSTSGSFVRVYRRRLNSSGAVVEEELGPEPEFNYAVSTSDGSYRASITLTSTLAKPELLVKTFDAEEIELGSTTVCAAPARTTADILIGGAPGARHAGVPRHAELASRIGPVRADTGSSAVALKDIQSSAYEHVACRTGAEVAEVKAMVEAAQLKNTYSAISQLTEETFFAILDAGVPLEEIFARRRVGLRPLLLDAVRRGRVAPSVEDDLDDVLDGFRAAAVIELSTVGEPSTREFTPIGELASLTPGIASPTSLVASYFDHEGALEEFVDELGSDSFRFSVDAAPLVQSWPSMITKLHNGRIADPPDHDVARDLAKHDETWWDELILDSGFPPSTDGADTAAKRLTYRKAIMFEVEQRFRTAFIGFRQEGDVLTFFDNNADFDFAKIRVDRYLDEATDPFDGISGSEAQAEVAEQLRVLERLYHVTSSWAEIQELLSVGDGLKSAYDIHALGHDGLDALTALETPDIDRIMTKVCWIVWGALGMHAKHSAGLHSLVLGGPRILPDQVTSIAVVPGIPDWTRLFGTLDQCACAHCRSVLSASAYLVGLLEMLRRVRAGADTALDEFLNRRPDIAKILLTCANSDTALPQADLLIEILEVFVATWNPEAENFKESFPVAPATIGTTEKTPQLLAHPEIVFEEEHVGAQTALATSLHPFSLPFHRWLKEPRAYLEHLGVPRFALIKKLAGEEGPDGRWLAIERLDLAPKQYDILAGTVSPPPEDHEFWGFPEATPSPAFDEQLRAVPLFLERAGLTYEELLDLMGTEYTIAAGVAFVDATKCSLEELELDASANPDWFAETHKLLRLRKVLGWSIPDTAKVKRSLGSDWAVATRAFGGVMELARRTRLSPLELASWFADMDVWPSTTTVPAGRTFDPPLFAKLFLNKAVQNPDEVALHQIWTAGSTSGSLADRALGLLPGLRISRQEFELLTNAALAQQELALFPEVLTTDATLESVSQLFRTVSKARAAQMRPRDFAILRALATTKPDFTMPGEAHAWRADHLTFAAGSATNIASVAGLLENDLTVVSPATKPVISAVGGEPAFKFVANSYLKADLPTGSETFSSGAMLFVFRGHSKVGWSILATMGLASAPTTDEVSFYGFGATELIDKRILGRRKAAGTGDVFLAGVDDGDHTILFTWSTAGALLYVDGELKGGNEISATANAISRFVLGDSADLAGGATAVGVSLAEVRLGNTTLDGTQVAAAFAYANARYFPTAEERAEDSLRLLDLADLVRETRAPLDEIHYVIRHVAPANSGLDPTGDVLTGWLAELGKMAETAKAEASQFEDPEGAALAALVTSLDLADELVLLAEDDDSLDEAARETLLETIALYLENLEDAEATLVPPTDPEDPEVSTLPERRTYLARELYRFSVLSGQVIAWVANTFGFSQESAAWLLKQPNLFGWALDASALFAFTRFPGWDAPTPDEPGVIQSTILLRLQKLGLLANWFKWSVADFKALFPSIAALPSFDLASLPTARPTTPLDLPAARQRFASWVRYARLARVRDAWAGGAESLLAFFTAAAAASPPTSAALDALVAAGMGWSLTDTAQLRREFGVPDEDSSDYEDERVLVRMVDAMALVKRLGTTADEAIAWAHPEDALPDSLEETGTSYTTSCDIQRAAKAKHTEEEWLKIARPLRDVLREKQRAVLVDKAIALDPSVKTPNDLYRKLLLDVEMSPCQLTSRIVMATGSVQLFMNRMLLGLEPTFTVSEELARQWQWMKNYRVWEANRKVFLWPENWIEPELRDDKTPLFRELETRLLQGALNLNRAEDAFRGYLDGLAEVANLEIVAMAEDTTLSNDPVELFNHYFLDRADRTLHVIGKNPSSGKHYYRKREAGRWTPWEKLDLEIDSVHIVAIAFLGHLYLFWPQWSTRVAREPSLDPPQKALEEWGIRIGWSELRTDGWTAPRYPKIEGATKGDFLWIGGKPDLHYLSFTAERVASKIRIQCLGDKWPQPGCYKIARFEFELGTERMGGTLQTPIKPGTVVPVIAPQTLSTAVSVDVYRPHQTLSHYQGFRLRTAADFRPWMPSADSDAPTLGRVFEHTFSDFIVMADRQAEPEKVRTPLFFTSERRTILLDQKQRRKQEAEASIPLLTGKWNSVYGTRPEADYFFRAQLHYHPYISIFRTTLAVGGLDAFFEPSVQTPVAGLDTDLDPVSENVETPLPKEVVDFTHNSAYGVYNWELFFHAPFLIAIRLGQEGRHDEAQRWFHRIFDPTATTGAAPARFWRLKPFRQNLDLATIQEDLTSLSVGQWVEEMDAWSKVDEANPVSDTLTAQIATWRNDPFDPHAIARLRISAYQKAVVIKYIENLLAWGDQLFARDTLEGINEATQLYILAQELLGDRPVTIRHAAPEAGESYAGLEAFLDDFGNAIAGLETIVPKQVKSNTIGCKYGAPPPEPLITGKTYFCVPPNEKLLGLWDLVADRLFKIRHCMNIEGVVRTLPLFEPPIDPALLVRAIAAGVDIASVLNDINAAAPIYRYSILFAKAQELAATVSSLGSMLLSALEKKDAEELSNKRAEQDIVINEMMRESRRTQVAEAQQNLRTLEQSLRSAETRRAYYESRQFIFPGEQRALDLQLDARIASTVAEGVRVAASIAHIFPNAIAGFPAALTQHGGSFVGSSMDASAGAISMVATQFTHEATAADRTETFKRRREDWDHQAQLARIEVEQVSREIVAAEIRLALAEHELTTTERQLEHAREIEVFLRRKFTNEELYGWMKGQLNSLYHQAFKLAYEAAKRAEKAFQYERGDAGQTFIQFGHWDGLKQGLLAGERLAHDLRRMDAAYVTQNKREFELTKIVSLAEHDPEALIALREGSAVGVTLKEDDYDRDFNDHYLRRIKSIAVTVPCTAGPFHGVLGTLELLKGETRPTSDAVELVASRGAIQSIVTSQGQMDTGMFEMSFRDERLLPFEGVGAHAEEGPQLRFTLSPGNRFAFSSIDDLILDIRYTARRGSPARTPPTDPPRTLKRLVRVKDEHAEAWALFKDGTESNMVLMLLAQGWGRANNEELSAVTEVSIVGWWSGAAVTLESLTLNPPSATVTLPTLAGNLAPKSTWTSTGSTYEFPVLPTPPDSGEWTLTFTFEDSEEAAAFRTQLQDLWIIFTYQVEA